mgnify:CR=1 FL=1
MRSETWRRRIGAEPWNFIIGDSDPDVVAEVMTRAYEMGWRGPEVQPRIDPEGSRVVWPSTDKAGVGSLTANGLIRHYEKLGNRWYLLRMPQLLRSVAGPLMSRLQEILTSYEAQCVAEGLEPLSEELDVAVFVGGEGSDLSSVEAGLRG